MARGLGGHRGSLMVSAAKVKAKYQAPPLEKVITVKCFKHKFFSTNDDFLNKHMTIEHLMGRGFKRMEKFVALATPNLLVSTLHKDDDEKILSEDSDDKADSLSEVSDIGVERLDEEDDNLGILGTDCRSPEWQTDSPLTAQQNIVSQTLNAENVCEGRGEERISHDKSPEHHSSFDNAFLESPALNVDNTQAENICQWSISPQNMRNAPPPNNLLNAENVTKSPEGRNMQRTTSTGGIRNTPQRQAQKRNNAGRKNLYGGKKKIAAVKDIGQFNTKYKAHEKTKLLLKKHAKELGEHLLKLNNTEVDGIKNAENGFFIAYKSAGKTFVAREGTFGKMFVEDEEYRGSLIEEAKVIDVQLNNSVLTSMLKSQYGASKTQNTPKKHKRKDYKGVGAQTKKSKAVEANKESETVDVSVEPRSVQTSRKKTKSQKANTEDTPTHSDDSINNIISDTSGNSDNSWLRSMIHEETEPRKQINSKPAKKQARQLFPYKCSECPSKYKTQNGYEKHLREKHGLI